MPRGQPDYGVYQQQQVITGLADVGEAAARLGSINVYDRRGFTVWQDDFEATILRWTASAIAGGVAPVLSSTQVVMGTQSVYLACAAGAANRSILYRVFPLIRLGKIGVEFWIQITKAGAEYIQLELRIDDGANLSFAYLRYYPVAGIIQISDAGVFTQVATNIYMLTSDWYFLPIKLVVDMDTDRYVRLLVGERDINLSAYSLAIVGATVNRRVSVEFNLYGTAASGVYAYLDNFILTQNEP